MCETFVVDGFVGCELLAVDHGFQPEVMGQPQLKLLAVRAVGEEWHFFSGLIWFHHQVNGEVFAAEVALRLTLHTGLTGELQTDGFRHIVVVHLTFHFKIGDGAQVIVLYALREVEDDVVAGFQNAAHWLWGSEELWTPCVLPSANNLRCGGKETVAVPAVEHCPEVVSFLHHRTFAVELSGDVTILWYHFTYTVGLSKEGGVGIVGTEVGPVVVATL